MTDLSRVLVAFDLDDTLYKECDYVKSGYIYVARELARELGMDVSPLVDVALSGNSPKHPFDMLYQCIGGRVDVKRMVEMYREHFPDITLPDVTRRCLDTLLDAGVRLALITDGRHVGQWNKIRALGLERYFNNRYISVSADVGYDKNFIEPWTRMETLTSDCIERWYIGDNPRKDFHHPRRLGWNTVMLRDDGRNIKTQRVSLTPDYHAARAIDTLSDLPPIILNR